MSNSFNGYRLRPGLLAGLIAVVMMVGACGSSSSAGAGGLHVVANGGTLVIVNPGGNFAGFDPQKDVASEPILENVYATLLTLNTSAQPIGFMAQTWSVTPSSITFTLKKGVTCSDGTPLTATDVMNSYQRMINIKSPYLIQSFGPGPYSMTADDASGSFTFNVGTPYGNLVYGFTNFAPGDYGAIICPAGLAAAAQPGDGLETAIGPGFGSGPYTFVSAVPGDHVTLQLRKDFAWGPDGVTAKTPGIPQTVTYQVIQDAQTAANELLTGQVNALYASGVQVTQLAANKSFPHSVSYSLNMIPLGFNELPGHVTADPMVRQALITALDPKAIFQASQSGYGELSKTILTPSNPCYDAAAAKLAPTPSVSAATAILVADGYTMSNGTLVKNGQPLTIHFFADSRFGAALDYFQTQWTQMGAVVSMGSGGDIPTMITVRSAGTFDAIAVFIGDVTAGSTTAQSYYGTNYPQGTNYFRIQDPILAQAGATLAQSTGTAKCAAYATFQEELWKGWHVLPLWASEYDWFGNGYTVSKEIGVLLQPMLMQKVQT